MSAYLTGAVLSQANEFAAGGAGGWCGNTPREGKAGGPTMPDTISPDLRDLLALHLVPGIGPRLTAALLERFGSAAAVRRASAAELAGVPRIGEQTAGELAPALREAD